MNRMWVSQLRRRENPTPAWWGAAGSAWQGRQGRALFVAVLVGSLLSKWANGFTICLLSRLARYTPGDTCAPSGIRLPLVAAAAQPGVWLPLAAATSQPGVWLPMPPPASLGAGASGRQTCRPLQGGRRKRTNYAVGRDMQADQQKLFDFGLIVGCWTGSCCVAGCLDRRMDGQGTGLVDHAVPHSLISSITMTCAHVTPGPQRPPRAGPTTKPADGCRSGCWGCCIVERSKGGTRRRG